MSSVERPGIYHSVDGDPEPCRDEGPVGDCRDAGVLAFVVCSVVVGVLVTVAFCCCSLAGGNLDRCAFLDQTLLLVPLPHRTLPILAVSQARYSYSLCAYFFVTIPPYLSPSFRSCCRSPRYRQSSRGRFISSILPILIIGVLVMLKHARH